MWIVGIFLGFLGMEVVGILIHKFLMHGPLWFIHKSHHQPKSGHFELNDLFSIFFAACGIVCLILGMANFSFIFFVGCGISVYGIAYFFLHDALIHRRFKLRWQPLNKYIKAMRFAHQMHHKSPYKLPSESYGLFFFSKKYFKNIK